MSEQNGSTEVVGNPAQAAVPTESPAAAPASEQTPAEQKNWYDGFADEDVGLVQNKGWKTAADAVKSYKHLEKMLGADRAGRILEMPKDHADQAAWDAVYSKLGRPEDPKAYKYEHPKDAQTPVDEPTLEWFRAEAHKNGLSQKQFEALIGSWNGMVGGRMSEMNTNQDLEVQKNVTALKQEWGREFDNRVTLASRAVSKFGGDDLKAYLDETGLGNHPALVKAFYNIGKSIAEDGMVESQGGSKFGMSPQEAKYQIETLKTDKEFMAKFIGGDKASKDKFTQLHNIAFGG